MACFNGSKFASLSNSIVTLYFPAFVGSTGLPGRKTLGKDTRNFGVITLGMSNFSDIGNSPIST